jgi:four helix bundle protein
MRSRERMPQSFEDLEVFKRAMDLMEAVYRATETFPSHERYGLTAQIRRASFSVISHLAEGQGRLTFGEWRQMLSQARGSLFEVQAQLIGSHRLKFLADETYAQLRTAVKRVAQPLTGLIRYVQRRERQPKTDNRQPATSAIPSPTASSP